MFGHVELFFISCFVGIHPLSEIRKTRFSLKFNLAITYFPVFDHFLGKNAEFLNFLQFFTKKLNFFNFQMKFKKKIFEFLRKKNWIIFSLSHLICSLAMATGLANGFSIKSTLEMLSLTEDVSSYLPRISAWPIVRF